MSVVNLASTEEQERHLAGEKTLLNSQEDPTEKVGGMSFLHRGIYFRTGKRILIVALFAGLFYFLFSGNGRLRRRNRMIPKFVSYSNGAIRTDAEILKGLGETCQHYGSSEKQYIHNRHAIVLDAGSTGTRVHVYEFQCCGDKLLTIADEMFEEVKPGLSSFGKRPLDAAKSLAPLIQKALARIPPFLHSCTPLVLKATAGLRLLPGEVVQKILESVTSWLRSHPFLLGPDHDNEKRPVSVMDGSEEAVLAWVTVNFLKKKIGADLKPDEDIAIEDTSIVMDLGGGSTQIVYAVPDRYNRPKGAVDPLKYPEFYYELKFHGRTHYLYQHSFLGYGLVEARKKIKQTYLKTRYSKKQKFACLPKEYSEDLPDQVEIITGDGGGFDRCLGVVEGIFDKSAPCALSPCSFNGIHQPAFPLPKSGKPSIVIFSYFYDRLIPLGLKSPMTLREIRKEAEALCSASQFGNDKYGRLLKTNNQWCLDVTYIYALLAYAYQIDLDTPLTVTKQVEGYEAGWALGSALKLLDQHANSCPVPPPSLYY